MADVVPARPGQPAPELSPGPVEGRGGRRFSGWLPVVLLLAGVANHLWQVHRNQLSPWLGAGFGMFSTTDVDSARQVYLTAVLADGTETEVELGEPFRDTWERARALPTGTWLSRLAESTFQALDETPFLEFSAPPRSLRIEVWRLSYQDETLQPSASLLAHRTFPFPPYAD